jgi:hypothetical protein
MHLPAEADLYRSDTDVPLLRGTRCAACGGVSFPPLSIGCDACGAAEDGLETTSLAMTGVVHSFARVCVHHGQPVEPFVVLEVRLDSGPLIRALATRDSSPPRIGDRVAAIWAPTGPDVAGNEVVEPAFATVTA